MKIQEWRQTIEPNQSSDMVISIAKVFSDCSHLWGVVVHILTEQHWVQRTTIRKLESAHSYIRLWADGYGVSSGQFEEKLKNSQRAGDLTIKLLQSICRTLTQELIAIVTGISTVASQDTTNLSLTAADLALSSERLAVFVQGDSDSDGDSDSEVSEDGKSVAHSEPASREELLDAIADDLRNDTQCLLDLGARFEERVMNPIANEAAANPLNSFNGGLSDTFTERIIRLYPRCERNLARRLGKANLLRFLRIVEFQPRINDGRVTQDGDTDTIHDATKSKLIEFESTDDISSAREKSLFHDSGLETAGHVRASFRLVARPWPEPRVFPRLPEGAVLGEPFCCIVCKNQVTMTSEGVRPRSYACHIGACKRKAKVWPRVANIKAHLQRVHMKDTVTDEDLEAFVYKPPTSLDEPQDNPQRTLLPDIANKQWREHLLRDIEPYVCPEYDCDAPLFTDTLQWETHLDSCHPHSTIRGGISCRICGEAVRRIEGIEHLAHHMEAIALTIIPGGPGIGVDKSIANDTVEDSDGPTFGLKQINKKILQTAFPRSGTECCPCKRSRRECDGKNPCENCKRRHINCSFYPPLPRSREAKAGSNVVAPPPYHHINNPDDASTVGLNPRRATIRTTDKHLPLDGSNGVSAKQTRNTLAAWKSRERKAQKLEEQNDRIAKLEEERDRWKDIALNHPAEGS